jgi:hypothetical protein
MERFEELQRNPAYQATMRHMEEMERNPVLKMALKQAEEQARNPLFQAARRSMREFDRLMATEHLRSWERQIPDWVTNPKYHSSRALDVALGNIKEIERLKRSLPDFGASQRTLDELHRISREAARHMEMRDLVGLRNWPSVANLTRDLTEAFRSLPPEVRDTHFGQAAQRLAAIRESAERQDPEKFDQEVNALASQLMSWMGFVIPHKLTTEAMLSIVIGMILAIAQTALSYKWRLDDQRDADRRHQELNAKLDALLSAAQEKRQEPTVDAGKPYHIERTTPVFSRPGPKRPRVGYVYKGQQVRALATTGRWIFIQYADPFNFELRAGWIRKKYATLEK